jgi:hypothetical protein
MSSVISSLLTICSLLLVALPDSQKYYYGSQQPGVWIHLDTLDLHLTGPCYDVAFYRNSIIFLKPGIETTFLTAMDHPDLNESHPLFSNKEFSCSPAAFSFNARYSGGYYSRPIWIEENLFEEKIFEMSIEGDHVSDIRQLPFTADSFRYLHPAIASDGSMMVFSSDMLPSSGGLDLFVTRKKESGWSQPVNLGESINSSGHEWFPFLDSHNNLLFSSTGHSGYGGYDIYICPYNGKEWGPPRNLGKSINSPQDELGFSIHPGNKMALFSRVLSSGSSGLAIRATPNEAAIEESGIMEGAARDISRILQQIAEPATQDIEAIRPRVNTEEIKPGVIAGPGQVIFRVQIISSLYENSFPIVFIEGKRYNTYEYYYMGSFRITVGEFKSLEEANAFRIQCLNSGFKQAFVAAFRDGERVTDPSVFKQ